MNDQRSRGHDIDDAVALRREEAIVACDEALKASEKRAAAESDLDNAHHRKPYELRRSELIAALAAENDAQTKAISALLAVIAALSETGESP